MKWNEIEWNQTRDQFLYKRSMKFYHACILFIRFIRLVSISISMRSALSLECFGIKWYRWHFRYEDEFYYAVMVMAKNLYEKQIHIKSSYGTYYIWTNTLSQFPWKMTKQWANRPVKPIAHSAKQRVEHERKKQNEVNK